MAACGGFTYGAADVVEDAAKLSLGPNFQNATAMTNAEVAVVMHARKVCTIYPDFVLYLEEPRVMQDSSILRYLCSSCCKKFRETGDKNLLIRAFLTNLAFEQKYGDPGKIVRGETLL